MRRNWPYLLFAGVSIVHLVLLGFASPGAAVTKWLLMPALLVAVLVSALGVGGARKGWRSGWGIALLGLGIVCSWAGDILLAVDTLLGIAAFAVAHLAYIALFLWPARRGWPSWWAGLYLLPYIALVVVLWGGLGDLRWAVLGYGLVLAGTAATATAVNRTTGVGGMMFFASDAVLALTMFGGVPLTPALDVAIMALYCLGQGLIAFGVVTRLHRA